jgi:hypothetical protein
MTELVALAAIVAVVGIVAIVFRRPFRGHAGPGGVGIEVGGPKGRRGK